MKNKVLGDFNFGDDCYSNSSIFLLSESDIDLPNESDKKYTLEQVISCAIDAKMMYADQAQKQNVIDRLQIILDKMTDPEYNEYRRLKIKFE